MTYILLDTNIYLHCQSFDSLPLKKIVGATDEVSILLPMQVLRELDKRKMIKVTAQLTSGRGRLAQNLVITY